MSRGLLVAVGSLCAALALGGCASGPASLSGQVRAWADAASLSANDAQIAADLGDIGAARRAGALGELKVSCAGLAIDAGTAYGELPTPDTALTAALNAGYEAYARAAQSCGSATSLAGPALARYDREVALAGAAMRRARSRLRALGVG